MGSLYQRKLKDGSLSQILWVKHYANAGAFPALDSQ